MRRKDNVIYHGVISFEEVYGEKYCNNTEKAMELTNEVMPKLLKRAGFNYNNITWFGAYHTNTDNAHITLHFLNIGLAMSQRNVDGKMPQHNIL